MYTPEQVRAYMRSRVTAHMKDRRWRIETPINGVYCEELAEDAANRFDAYEPPNAALPEQFLAWAIEIAQSAFDYVKVSYADGSSREGLLVDITDGVGTLREMGDTTTAFSVNDVVLDVLSPTAGQSMLVNYPFAKNDVIIFRDGQDDLQGRFARGAEREGGILVFAGGNLIGIFYSHIIRVRKPNCDFHVPPAYLGSRPTVEVGNVAAPVGEAVMDNITWAVNQLRTIERRPVTVESVYSVLFEEGMLCEKSTIKSALAQLGYNLS